MLSEDEYWVLDRMHQNEPTYTQAIKDEWNEKLKSALDKLESMDLIEPSYSSAKQKYEYYIITDEGLRERG